MVDFTGHEDPDFAFGQMLGIRSFKVGYGGYLTAVTYSSYIYKPGENLAGCIQFDTGPDGKIERSSVQNYGPNGVFVAASKWMDGFGQVYDLIRHRVGIHWCRCGFYGYYDRRFNDYATAETVTGIVAAYGRVSYSNRGFRASKLKLVAAVNPYLSTALAQQGPVIPEELGKRLTREKQLSSSEHWLHIRAFLAGCLAANMGLTLYALLVQHNFYGWAGWILTAVLLCWMCITPLAKAAHERQLYLAEREHSEIVSSYSERLGRLFKFERNKGLNVSSAISTGIFEKIAERYPEIKWYRTVEEMIAAHSITQYKETPGYTRDTELRQKYEKRYW